jgi:hypothetical protein
VNPGATPSCGDPCAVRMRCRNAARESPSPLDRHEYIWGLTSPNRRRGDASGEGSRLELRHGTVLDLFRLSACWNSDAAALGFCESTIPRQLSRDMKMPGEKLLLTKSGDLCGLQCPKLLWTYQSDRTRLPEPGEAQQAVFDQGHEVGRLAKS